MVSSVRKKGQAAPKGERMAFIRSYNIIGHDYQLLSKEGKEPAFVCTDKIRAREILS